MIFIKQLFCKHEWEREELERYNLRGKYFTGLYSCNKCGKLLLHNHSLNEKIWRRKRELKGDTFID